MSVTLFFVKTKENRFMMMILFLIFKLKNQGY